MEALIDECKKDIETLNKHASTARIKKMNRYLIKVLDNLDNSFPHEYFKQWKQVGGGSNT